MNTLMNEYRKKRGLTVEAFAREYGISLSLAEKLLYGDREPSKAFLRKIKQLDPEVDINIFFLRQNYTK